MADSTPQGGSRRRWLVMIGGGVGAGVGGVIGAIVATKTGVGAIAPALGGGLGALLGYSIVWALSRRNPAEPGAAPDRVRDRGSEGS